MAPALGRMVHLPRQRRQRGKGKADGRSPKSTPASGNFTKLRRVRTRRRAQRGDEWLHPLSLLEFLDKDFGQRPLLLQRGPLHRLPLSSSTAAELLRSYRMGINAHVVSSRSRTEKTASLSVGAKPLDVLAQGRSLRLDHLERRKEPPCLKWILKRLKDVTPGLRSPTLSLTWAPPWVSPSFGRAKTPPWTSHRLHLQLFGARQWTLCNDPLGPEVATPNASAVNASGSDAAARCQRFRLRRGDLLYVPPGLWHGATAGAALSAHLTLTLQPLTMQELLLAGSPGGSLSGLPTGAHGLAQPLPLWRSDPALRDLCLSLPWRQAWHRDNACKEDHLHLALQRLFLGLGRRSPRRGLGLGGLPVTNSEEPKREFQSQHFESRRPEGREGNRQRRKRELIFMALCWPILIFVVTFLTYLCCPNGKAHSTLQPSADDLKKYQ